MKCLRSVYTDLYMWWLHVSLGEPFKNSSIICFEYISRLYIQTGINRPHTHTNSIMQLLLVNCLTTDRHRLSFDLVTIRMWWRLNKNIFSTEVKVQVCL